MPTKVVLKNVLTPNGDKTITAEVLPFDRRKDEHVEFAYSFADMHGGAPSTYKTLTDAAKAYVQLFMVHKEEDGKNPESDYYCVLKDIRASRTLFNQEDVQKTLFDFFTND